MCSRYTLHHSAAQIAAHFAAQPALFAMEPRYNIAPTQAVVIVRQNGVRTLEAVQWGLVPSWAKDSAIASKLLNARAESLAERPAFRNALSRRRCLIPADGFYEWIQEGKLRQPYYIRRRDGGIFAFAGLWDEWRGADTTDLDGPSGSHATSGEAGPPLRSCVIVTVPANPLLTTIHSRMPALLLPDQESAWIDPASTSAADLLPLLRPCPESLLEMYPVARRVNSPAVDEPGCIEPLPPDPQATLSLF
jgi:putative SOS response-associated peptidase YedK